MITGNLGEVRAQVADVVAQPNVTAAKKLAQVLELLGLPALRRGRKPKEGTPLNFSTEYQKARQRLLIKLGRCIECGKHNHRWPKSRCSACLQKKTVKARRKQIESRLE